MRPEAFLTFAKACQSLTDSEAALRSSISRAYYAAYHSSVQYLNSESPSKQRIQSRRTHRAVIGAVRQELDESTAGRLSNLKDIREHADYELDIPIVARRAHKSILLAEKIVRRCSVVEQE